MREKKKVLIRRKAKNVFLYIYLRTIIIIIIIDNQTMLQNPRMGGVIN